MVPRKKSPVTPPGINPGTLRLVAQRFAFIASGFWPHSLHSSAGGTIVDVLDNFFFVFVVMKLSFVAIFSNVFGHAASV